MLSSPFRRNVAKIRHEEENFRFNHLSLISTLDVGSPNLISFSIYFPSQKERERPVVQR